MHRIGMMEDKHDNFVRISEKRTNKILDMITGLRNFSNTNYYEYSDEEIQKLFDAIQEELDETRGTFDDKKGKSKRFKY